jgi:hypothetical protein
VPKKFFYKTPKGEFASAAQAGAAHKCDKSTIINRCETDPGNYQQIPIPPKPPKPTSWSITARTTWPLTWSQYKGLSFEVKDEIWLRWCVENKRNPDLESTVDEFFDQMDNTQEVVEDDKEQVI